MVGISADVTGRRVSIEHGADRDINDQPAGRSARPQVAYGNWDSWCTPISIPLNPTGSQRDASPKPVEREFVRRVRAQGVSCTVRDTRGQEIAAACGQLAAEQG